MRICWADDKPDEARTFAGLLDSLEPTIDFAADGNEALALMREYAYDLVIVDLQMLPGEWGGLWLLNELQTHAVHPPALILSGEGTQDETIEAMRLGARDYVQKARVKEELKVRVLAVAEAALALLLAGEESERVEFKETLRWDVKQERINKDLEKNVVKAIAGLANASGGSVVIGRADSGQVPGIDRDLGAVPGGDLDGFERQLRNRVTGALGADSNRLVRIRFPVYQGAVVAVVDVVPSSEPLFARDGGSSTFFVRGGNGTRPLDPEETHRYISQRFR